jgi:beta-lactam-binding protein with PASTA domain
VIGESYEKAKASVQRSGFIVARRDVDSDRPEGVVVDQDPPGRTLRPKRSKVTLSVSKGPQTGTVPDVTNLDEETAKASLEHAGFEVEVQTQDVKDEGLDGLVVNQDPPAGKPAESGATVTIYVGRFEEGP